MEKLRLLGSNDIHPKDMKLTPDGFVYDFNIVDPNSIPEILKFKEMRAQCMISNFWSRIDASKIQFSLMLPNAALLIHNIAGSHWIGASISFFGIVSCTFFGFKMLKRSFSSSMIDEVIDENHSKFPGHMKGKLNSIMSSMNIDDVRVYIVRVVEKNKFGYTGLTNDKQFVIIGKSTSTNKTFLLHHEPYVNNKKDSFLCKLIARMIK